MARPPLTFERESPWEAARGSTRERTLDVHAEAQRVYAQQQALLPALQLERAPDPEAAARVRDIGRRTRVLREHESHGWRPGGSLQKSKAGSPAKRVVPSRFPEEEGAGDTGDGGGDAPGLLDARIEMMRIDQEWDTRGWTRPKIHAAVDALYSEVEGSADPSRRELATTMLVRLLEVHEDAVDFVETTVPTLSNRAFRTLTRTTDNQRTFRVAALLGVLSQWFARVLSAENAVGKSVGCLLRETELCARIVQHHWRGVRFERGLHKREYDPGVRARIRAMHLVQFVELRHQFKVFREVVGRGGLPMDAVQAYVSIVYRLVQNRPDDVDAPRGTAAPSPAATPSYVVANQRKLVSSGALAVLASLVTAAQRPSITAMVLSIVTETALGLGPDKIVDVLQSNIVERAQAEMQRVLGRSELASSHNDGAMMDAVLHLIGVLSDQVLAGLRLFGRASAQPPSLPMAQSTHAEDAFMLGKLTRVATTFLINNGTVEALLRVLHASCATPRPHEARCAKVLSIVRVMACCSFGFPLVLDGLTRDGGRHMELVLQCLLDQRGGVASEALALYCEVTDHPHGRQGFTTAGAVRTLVRWCQCQPGSESAEERERQVVGLLGIALIARQSPQHDKVALSWLLPAAQTACGRTDALYQLLLDLVATDREGGKRSAADAEQSAAYLLRTNALAPLVQFLTPVTPTCMEPAAQSPRHRNISCIVLSRFFRLPLAARASFSEDVVNHLALSLQCNRLDEVEQAVSRYSEDARLIHRLGSMEACKALTRLARCSSGHAAPWGVGDGAVVARLRPSVTSRHVPELPQAMVCDVLVRLHVVEDLVACIKPVDWSADAPDVEAALTGAAVELAGHLRPLPYGEAARARFFRAFGAHDHGRYACDKLALLVELAAPSILRVLREPSLPTDLVDACCAALSRLACTNAACSALLLQGCLQTALLHLPAFLSDLKWDKASGKRKPEAAEWVVDSTADPHGLRRVPAALYTLLGKLCAVAEGRAAVLRAQVLPRVLKRLQLRDQAPSDVQCKSEIAVLVTRLAMVSTAEGNTSELFVHFGVLDLLMRVLQAQLADKHDEPQATTRAGHARHVSNAEAKRLRVVEHVLGAIAALSQDLLVCVPRLVALGVLRLLSPLLGVGRLGNSSLPSSSARTDAIQLHTMRVVHSIAAYPFGEYHPLLASAGASDAPWGGVSCKRRESEATPPAAASSLMDQVRRIGYDVAAEMRGREAATTVGSKTVGDLARETLSAMNEQKRAAWQSASESAQSLSGGGRRLEPPPSQPLKGGAALAQTPPPTSPSVPSNSCAAFPALRSSVSKAPTNDSRRPRRRPTSEPSAASLPSAGSNAAVSPPATALAAPSVVTIHPASPSKLHGVDLATTRPPGSSSAHTSQQRQPGQAIADNDSSAPSPRYIFATPKPTKRPSARDAAISSLMLDPLFDSAPPPTKEKRHRHRHRHQHEEQQAAADDEDGQGFPFLQETDRFGHLVLVKGRRVRRGDRYVPALGLIASDAAPTIAYHS